MIFHTALHKTNGGSVIPLDGLWKEYNRIIKDNGVIVLTSHGLFTSKLMLSNTKDFKYKWIWAKSKATNFLNAKKQPLRKYEEICVFYKRQPTYNPQMTIGSSYDKGGIRKDQLSGSYGDFDPVRVKSDGERYPVDLLYILRLLKVKARYIIPHRSLLT